MIFKNVNRNVRWTQVNWQTVPHGWTVDRETTISIICPCPRNIHLVQVGGSKARTARTVRRRMTESHEVWWCQTAGALEDKHKQCCLEIYTLSDWQPVQILQNWLYALKLLEMCQMSTPSTRPPSEPPADTATVTTPCHDLGETLVTLDGLVAL